MNDEQKRIYQDALKDVVGEILGQLTAAIGKIAKIAKRKFALSDDAKGAIGELITARGVAAIADRNAPLDAAVWTQAFIAQIVPLIKDHAKLTAQHQEALSKVVEEGTGRLFDVVRLVRQQSLIVPTDAKAEINKLLSLWETNWNMPDQYAFEAAQEMPGLHPTLALIKAHSYIRRLRGQNEKEQIKLAKARALSKKLHDEPITNAGTRTLVDFAKRWLLSLLNATPFNNFTWIEVNHEGLQIYTPLAAVSQRTIRYPQLVDGQVVLSVNPPVYLDQILGLLKQFRRNVMTPWGEIIVYEPGSGRNIARAIALWPDQKIKEMREALETLSILENPYRRHKRLPRLRDLLIYYETFGDDGWDQLAELDDHDADPDSGNGNLIVA